MELLLALLLLNQASNKSDKPLSEQDSSELAASLSKVMHTLESANDSMKKAEVNMNKKRQELKRIESNAEKALTQHKIKKGLITAFIGAIFITVIAIQVLDNVNPMNLPYWLQNFVEHNRFNIALFAYSSEIGFYMSIVAAFFYFTLWIMISLLNGNTRKVKTPLEKFLDSERSSLASEEREYKEYLVKCNDGLAELKVKALEINQYIQKRNQLKKSVS